MGFLDELKKLTRPYDDDEDDMMEDNLPEEDARLRTPVTSAPRQNSYDAGRNPFSSDYSEYNAPAPKKDNKVVNIRAATQVQVVLVKPERFEAAAEIADHLRDKRTVVMNLEQTNKDVSRRLIDFLSGVAYAQDGKIKKVAVSTYIITPYNVDIVGDLIDELESNGVYF